MDDSLSKEERLLAFVALIARTTIPGDDDAEMKKRVADGMITLRPNIDESEEDQIDPVEAVMVDADDEFLCVQTEAFFETVREARELLK